jgi:ATP-dependent protease ClpP protease subunit
MSRKKYSLVGEICDIEYRGAWGDYCAPGPLKAFLKTLGKDDVAEIEINSPGGYVLQGIEMANAIKNCPAKVVAHVTGIAASMASVVMCACDEIEMEEASFAMFHDPWGFAMGNAREMRKEADLLDQMKSVIMSFYRGKFAKKSNEEISAMLSDETWYTGSECAENGMACTIIPATVRAAAMVNCNFANIPEGAKKFMSAFTLSDTAKAELEKLRAKAAATEEEETPAEEEETPAEEEETPAEEEETPAEEEETPAEEKETPAEEEEETPPPSPSGAVDWQARYKGASKKINELTAAFNKCAAAAQTLNDFNGQIKNAGFENLAALLDSVSTFKAELEKRDQALARMGE